jgi:iron complex outermembrane receptor protein
VNSLPAGSTKSRALEGLRLDEPQGGHNTIASLDWWHPAVLGSRAHAQLYYRDYLTRFSPFAWTVPFRTEPDDPASQIDSLFVSQSFVDSRRAGGRLELETPLDDRGSSLVWGLDASTERTSQALTLFENQPYFDSDGLVFRTTGERGWVPEIAPRSLGLFAQLGWRATERVLLRGGVRHERATWSADDFMTVRNYRVEGGTVDYAPVLVNLGTVVGVGVGVDLFASFSQGFSLADLGRALRDAPAGFSLGEQSIEPQRVDQWEVGARGAWSRVESSISAFYNTSDLGATFAADLTIQRAPERVYGLEGTLDVRASDVLDIGGTLSWTEGRNDLDRNGTYKALDGFRIAPPKATAYLQHRTRPGWSNRVQVLHSGRRDEAFEDGAGYGRGIVESYTVVDLVSALVLAHGTVTVGVHNLLDRDYFSPASQLMMSGNASRAMAPGATLSVGYVVEY